MPNKDRDGMVEEAMEDWERRGYPANSFSLDKMIEIWEREEMSQMEMSKAGGKSSLKRKQELISASSWQMIDWAKVQQKLVQGAELFQEKATIAAFYVGRALEPPPMRRARQWREHRQLMIQQDDNKAIAQQLQREGPYDKLTSDKRYQDTEAREYRRRRRGIQAIFEKRAQEAKQAREADAKFKEDQYEAKRRIWEFDDNERTRIRREQAEQKYVMQEKYRRRMNDLYWHQNAAHKREESRQLAGALHEYRRTEREKAIRETENEQQEGQSMEGPAISVTRPGLAVFGTPLMPGDYANPVSGGHDTEQDFMEVDLFVPNTNTQFENRKRLFWQMHSEAVRLREATNVADAHIQALGKEIEALIQRDELLRDQWEEIQTQEGAQLRLQGGPPRRDPNAIEKRRTFARKNQQRNIETRRAALNKRVRKLQEDRGHATRQHLVSSSRCASLEKRVGTERTALEALEMGGEPTLPIVIGRRLDRAGGFTLDGKQHEGLPGVGDGVAGSGSLALPHRTMQMIQLRSKHELLNAGSKVALRSFEEAKSIDMTTWRLSYQAEQDKAHIESLYNKMAAVEGKLMKVKGDCLRRDLIGALERWRLNEERLRDTSRLKHGQLNWWQSCDEKGTAFVEECLGIEGVDMVGQKEQDGVTEALVLPTGAPPLGGGLRLADGEMDGEATGKITFPHFSKWRVTIVCSRDDPEEMDEELSDDFVEVQFGSCQEDRMTFARFLNRKAPGRFGVVYVKKYEFVGTCLWFRILFRSDVEQSSRHMALLASTFEELEQPEYDVVDDTRILSAFVKNERWEATKPKTRSTTIIQELMALESGASTQLIDSTIYHWGVLQRFNRKQLRQLLLAELDGMNLEGVAAADRAKWEKQLREERQRRVETGETMEEVLASESQTTLDKLFFDDTISQEERELLQQKEYKKSKALRVKESEQRYWKRKAVRAQAKIDPSDGFLLVDQKLELWDAASQAWQKAVVREYRFEWVEHGTVLRKEWRIHYITEDGEEEEESIWLNLEERKYNKLKHDNSSAVRARKAIEAREAEREKAAAAEEAQEREHVAAAHRWLETEMGREDRQMEERWAKYVDKAVTAARTKAQAEMKTAKVKTYLTARAHDIRDEYKDGRTAGAGSKFLTMRQAMSKAEEEFSQRKGQQARDTATLAIDEQRLSFGERRKEKLQAGLAAISAQTEQRALVKKRKKALATAELEAEKAALVRRLQIPPELFRRALPGGSGCCEACEGSNVAPLKAWGSKYAQGAVCSKCGIEVVFNGGSTSQNAARQQTLDILVAAQRENEAGFRATPEQMAAVEAERIRLEKERRELQLANVAFADNDALKSMAKLDFRHGQRLGNLDLIGCPTFRANDIRGRVQYNELIRRFARINASRKRQADCGEQLGKLQELRFELSSMLKTLHSAVPLERARMELLEEEHLRAHQMLFKQEAADRLVRKLQFELQQALQVLERACIDLVGRVERADLADEGHALLVKQLHSALRHRKAAASTYAYWMKRHKGLSKRLERDVAETEKATQELVRLQYRRQGQPIRTPYGWASVLLYREKDDMIIASLKFNKSFRLFIPLEKVVLRDQTSQQAENLNMAKNEEESRQFVEQETRMWSAELPLMAAEEEAMRVLCREEAEVVADAEELKKAVASADADASEMMLSPLFDKLMHDQAVRTVKQIAIHRKEQAKEFKGKGYAAKDLTLLERLELTKQTKQKNIEEYHQQEVSQARATTLQTQQERQHRKRQEAISSTLIDDMAQDLLEELCKESLRDSLREQQTAEHASQVVLDYLLPPDLPRLHFGVYNRVCRHWLLRKDDLRRGINKWKEMGERAVRRMEEEEIRKAEENRHRAERAAIRLRCQEMKREEKETRAFMRAELKLELGERRAMKAEEKLMKKFLKAEAQAKKDLEAGSGNVGVALARRKAPTANEHARMNVKQRKFEKRRLAREWEEMEWEDKLGKAMRNQYRQEAMAREAELQNAAMGEDDESASDDASDEDEDDSSSESEDGEEAAFDSDDLGDEEVIAYGGDDDGGSEYSPPPPPPDNETGKQKRRRLRREKKAAERERIKRAKQRKRDALLREINMQLDDLIVVAVLACYRLELNRMQVQEDKWQAFRERDLAKVNAEKFALYSQKKGQQEIRDRLEKRRLRKAADEATAAKDHAQEAVTRLLQELEEAQLSRRKIYRDTKWMDSRVVHDNHGQRMLTKNLYRILHREYFVVMVRVLALKAEIIALERKLFRCCSEIQHVQSLRRDKSSEEAKMWRSHRRAELLVLQRSALGKEMFGRSQINTIRKAFTGWTKFWLWRMSLKAKFSMVYSLKKQGIDIQRADEELDAKQEREVHGVDLGRRGDGTDPSEHVQPTALAKHHERLKQCQLSGKSFSSNQLHPYHPGKYEMACPSSCPHCDADGFPTTLCRANRVMRWTCCDVREEGRHGDNGCCFRYYKPPATDASCDVVMAEVEMRDKLENEFLKRENAKIDRVQAVRKTRATHMATFNAIEQDLVAERLIVARHAQLPKEVADRGNSA